MYNVDNYFDFDKKSEINNDKKQHLKLLSLLLLVCDGYYYLKVYLPEEEKKEEIMKKLEENISQAQLLNTSVASLEEIQTAIKLLEVFEKSEQDAYEKDV